jgi:hypothetical protein
MAVSQILRLGGTVVFPMIGAAIALWATWWLLALGGLFADVPQLRNHFMAELLFMIAATAIAESASPPTKNGGTPPLEAFALAVGTFPAFAQATLSALYEADWANPEIQSTQLPNLFAALLYSATRALTWYWYIAGLFVLLASTLLISFFAARRTAASWRDGAEHASFGLYASAVALLTVYLLLLSPEILSETAVSFDVAGIIVAAGLVAALSFLMAMLVASAKAFRAVVRYTRAIDLRIVWIACIAFFALFVASILLWGAWELAKTLSAVFREFARAYPAQEPAARIDFRVTIDIAVLALAALAIVALVRLWRVGWARVPLALTALLSALQALTRAGWNAAASLSGSMQRWHRPLLAALALLLLGPSLPPVIVQQDPGDEFAGPIPPTPPPPQGPPPSVRFQFVSLDCAPLDWEYDSLRRLEVTLNNCQLYESDVRYIVAVGRASFERRGHAREHRRAFDRASALADVVRRAAPEEAPRLFTLSLGMMQVRAFQQRAAYVIVGRSNAGDRDLSFEEFQQQLAAFISERPEVEGASQCVLATVPQTPVSAQLGCNAGI